MIGSMSDRDEGIVVSGNGGSKKYDVYVDDNFHYRDESERYKLGEFSSCEEAVRACMKIVDEFFDKDFDVKITYEELYGGYTMFGEDPFIVSDDEGCFFSAWEYAKEKSKKIVARNAALRSHRER
jgi:hypothetical protein